MSNILRLARKLARELKYAAHPLDGGGVTPEERAALDRVVELAGKVITRETIAQCEGEQDAEGRAACHGSPVRQYNFDVPPGSEVTGPMGARWCDDCRALAESGGYRVFWSSDVLAPKPTSYPCRNACNGCKQKVTREAEHCSTSCMMEYLGESFSGNGRYRED